MHYQICYNSVTRLRALLIENQLLWSLADVKENIKMGIKTNIDICQRNIIEKYIRLGEATKEIRNRAKANLGKHVAEKDTKAWKKEIKRLWKLRLTQKNKEIRQLNVQWWKHSSRVERLLPLGVRRQFKTIKSEELNRVWTLEKRRTDQKLQRQTKPVPDKLEGIKGQIKN